ncbi:MAG: CPBP family intramembrane metalloprotease [Sedimenticola sp.]|nr:CPBP family intramembrane metalloprotease [Sedimenticola sp.]
MRAFSYFVLLILGALVISALINYPIYALLQEGLSKGPHKLINTTAKLIAIPGFILLLRHFAIANKTGLGYGLPRPAFIRDLLHGWLSGFLILLLLSAVLLLLGVRVIRPPVDELFFLLFKTTLVALIGGLLIGFIEETFFRGGLFSAIRKQHSFTVTLLLSSLFYAGLHFINPPPLTGDEAHTWFSGIKILSGAFSQYTDWAIFDSFLALFGLGAFFAVVRERTGNIAYCIGLHAGFVFVIKLVRQFTELDTASAFSFVVGNYDGMIGYLSAAGMLVHTLIVYRYWRVPKQVLA